MSTTAPDSLQLLPPPGQLGELKRAYNQANDALLALRFEAEEFSRESLRVARERIAAEVEQHYGAAQAQLREAIAATERALEDEKDRLARAGIPSSPVFANSAPLPAVGTVMIEDEEAISRLKRAPRRAVVEIVNRDTFTEATNKLRSGLGDVVLRLLRADGTLTSEYAPMDRYRWRVDAG